MTAPDSRPSAPRRHVSRRDFVKVTGLGAAALVAGARPRRAAAAASPYPEWIPASTKPAKRGGSLTRASAWDPPVLDPRLTQSVGLYQFVGPHQQPPRPLPVLRRGQRAQRPHAQGRPRGVVDGQRRQPRVDLQAPPGREVAERGAAQRARVRRRRRQVLLRGSTPRKVCRRSRSRRSRGSRRRTSTRSASTSRRRTRCSRRTSPSRSRSSSPAKCWRRTATSRSA